MADGVRVRTLNQQGTNEFRQFVELVRAGATADAPLGLLSDPSTSDELEPEIVIAPALLSSRMEMGRHLTEWLAPIEQRAISRNAGLWNWLSLYLFDRLCPSDASGKRSVKAVPHYILDDVFVHNRYYRHLVRFAWLAYLTHHESAHVLLVSAGADPNGVGQWGDLSEQLGARQDIFASRTVVEAAAQLYLGSDGAVIRGFATRGHKGVVRRLADIVGQLSLTYDLRTCPVGEFLNLLPSEFERWLREYKKRMTREKRDDKGTFASQGDGQASSASAAPS
jgi:hypothetical protein